jgi:transposase
MILRAMVERDARSLSHEASAELRRRAIRMVFDGHTQRAVARMLDVHEVTVSKWMGTFREKGEALFEAKEAPGARPKLSERQIKQLRRVIVGKNPQQLNFGPALWTLQIIGQLVESKFGIVLHNSTIWRMLHRIGVTPQQPTRRAFQRDDEECRRWMERDFPKVVERAKRKQAVLLFADETGVHEDHAVGTTWGERGRTPIVRVSGARRRVNVISAISPRGRIWFRCFKGTLTATRYVEFLTALLQDVRGYIVLVHDGHPAHTAAATRRFLRDRANRIEVHQLPAYAPDLNPDEHVWSYVKGTFRSEPIAEGEDFDGRVEAAMLGVASVPKLVRSFFDHPAVAYVKKALNW